MPADDFEALQGKEMTAYSVRKTIEILGDSRKKKYDVYANRWRGN